MLYAWRRARHGPSAFGRARTEPGRQWVPLGCIVLSSALLNASAHGEGDNGPVPADDADLPFYDEMTIVGTRDDVEPSAAPPTSLGQRSSTVGYADISGSCVRRRRVRCSRRRLRPAPNISIRGVGSERSGRITLLEDNASSRPRPTPPLSVTILRRAGCTRSSPERPSRSPRVRTPSAAPSNMVSTPIPPRSASFAASGRQDATAGPRLERRVTAGGLGFLVETQQCSPTASRT